METKIITVAKEKNWAGNDYLLYKDGEKIIAELDYPDKYHKLPRIYCSNVDEGGYVSLSSIPQALVAAETVCKGYMYDRQYFDVQFKYPKTIKMK